jgi:hypothetical protein
MGLSKVCEDGKWSFIGTDGKARSNAYDEVGEFEDGIAKVKLAGKWGLMDNKYDEVLAPIYDEIGEFENGLAKMKLEGKWGLVAQSGRGITVTKYDEIGNFVDGVAPVTIGELHGYITPAGNEVIPVLYTAEEAANVCKDFLYYQQFSNYAAEYMAPKIKAFKVKDEFETQAQYNSRVNDDTIAALEAQLTKEAEGEYVKEMGSKIVLQLTLGTYHADEEYFPVMEATYGTFKVKVPQNVAREFKSLWDGIVKSASFCVKNDKLAIVAGGWCFFVTAACCLLGVYDTNTFTMCLNIATPIVLTALGVILPMIKKREKAN